MGEGGNDSELTFVAVGGRACAKPEGPLKRAGGVNAVRRS